MKANDHITVREFIEVLKTLNQDALIVMSMPFGGECCNHAFCGNAITSPAIQRTTSRHHEGVRYLLRGAHQFGDECEAIIPKDVVEG